MPELSRDVKKLIKDEVSGLIDTEATMIERLRVYEKRHTLAIKILGLAIATLFGGSILGVLTFNKHIDDRISEFVSTRIQHLDLYPVAISQAMGEHWDVALHTLDTLQWRIEDSKIKTSDTFRLNFINTLIWVLSNTGLDADGRWVGQDHWQALSTDKHFRRLSLELKDDGLYQYNLGIVEAKFSPDDPLVLSNVRSRMSSAYRWSIEGFERARLAYQMAILFTINNEREAALACFTEASDLDPGEYKIEDWFEYKGSFTNAPFYKIWSDLALKQKSMNLSSELDVLLSNHKKERSDISHNNGLNADAQKSCAFFVAG